MYGAGALKVAFPACRPEKIDSSLSQLTLSYLLVFFKFSSALISFAWSSKKQNGPVRTSQKYKVSHFINQFSVYTMSSLMRNAHNTGPEGKHLNSYAAVASNFIKKEI